MVFGSNLPAIDRRDSENRLTAIGCFAYLFYYSRLGDIRGRPSSPAGYDHTFVEPWGEPLALRSITTHLYHTYDITRRENGQHTPRPRINRLLSLSPAVGKVSSSALSSLSMGWLVRRRVQALF
jgi:hypothetical protein